MFRKVSKEKIDILIKIKNGERIIYNVNKNYSLWNQNLVEIKDDGFLSITKEGEEFLSIKDNTSLLEKIVNFINSKEIGTIIKRKELLELAGHKLEKGQTASFNTIDCYRLALTNESYLEKCKKAGWYKIINRIPQDLTYNDLRYGWTSKLVKRKKGEYNV